MYSFKSPYYFTLAYYTQLAPKYLTVHARQQSRLSPAGSTTMSACVVFLCSSRTRIVSSKLVFLFPYSIDGAEAI